MNLDLESIFGYHRPPNENVMNLHQSARDTMYEAAKWVEDNVPNSPERTLAIRHLQQAMMFANSAIAQGFAE